MLPGILNEPTSPAEWLTWSWNHQCIHNLIAKVILARGGSAGQVNLDPMPTGDLTDWLARNESAHNEMNSQLGLRGSDLSSVDMNDDSQRRAWIWLEYSDLLAVCQMLKIGP